MIKQVIEESNEIIDKELEQIRIDIEQAISDNIHFFEFDGYENYDLLVNKVNVACQDYIEKHIANTLNEKQIKIKLYEPRNLFKVFFCVKSKFAFKDEHRKVYIKWDFTYFNDFLKSIEDNDIYTTIKIIKLQTNKIYFYYTKKTNQVISSDYYTNDKDEHETHRKYCEFIKILFSCYGKYEIMKYLFLNRKIIVREAKKYDDLYKLQNSTNDDRFHYYIGTVKGIEKETFKLNGDWENIDVYCDEYYYIDNFSNYIEKSNSYDDCSLGSYKTFCFIEDYNCVFGKLDIKEIIYEK